MASMVTIAPVSERGIFQRFPLMFMSRFCLNVRFAGFSADKFEVCPVSRERSELPLPGLGLFQ